MNAAQLHLAINHLPVIVPFVGSVVLGFGLLFRSPQMQKTGLWILLAGAVSAIPTYLSGEPAESLLKNYPGVSRELMHRHQDFAKLALIAVLIAGASSLAALVARRARTGVAAVALALSLASFAMMLWTAHLGGVIRHEEIQTESNSQ